MARAEEELHEQKLLGGNIDSSASASSGDFICAAAQSSEFWRRCGDNRFGLSVVEQRLMKNTSAAPSGSLLLMLLCLQNTQLGHASAEKEISPSLRFPFSDLLAGENV